MTYDTQQKIGIPMKMGKSKKIKLNLKN
jgi:hypothetical protein